MAASTVVLVRDLTITPQTSDVVSRDVVRPFLGAFQQLLANTRVEVTFSVELAGSGTGVLLQDMAMLLRLVVFQKL